MGTKSLVMEAITNAGNPDYIVFDPESNDPSRRQPWISFRIVDEGDPHQYEWRVYIKSTAREEWEDYAVITGTSKGPGKVTARWDGRTATGGIALSGPYTFYFLAKYGEHGGCSVGSSLV